MSDEVVPLPEHLSHCGCKFAPTRHATTCQVAIDFDAIPLSERPEYELGKRFAAIGWDYPLSITTVIHLEVSLDPIAVILAHADAYERFEVEPGYHDWEKPMLWLTQQVEEQVEMDVWFGKRRLANSSSYLDEIREFPHWTEQDTDRLNEALARRVNPDQGVLEV